MTDEKRQRIWQVIQQIPAGRVASYGRVAELAGLAGCARLVGNTLRNLPEATSLPWHRVVNSQRKISLPPNTTAYREQKQRLLSEGIIFNKDKISIRQFI
ncbi:MAG: MGMT family protein [Spongiibacteraceae bacterium]